VSDANEPQEAPQAAPAAPATDDRRSRWSALERFERNASRIVLVAAIAALGAGIAFTEEHQAPENVALGVIGAFLAVKVLVASLGTFSRWPVVPAVLAEAGATALVAWVVRGAELGPPVLGGIAGLLLAAMWWRRRVEQGGA
jgi:hypothetical protein